MATSKQGFLKTPPAMKDDVPYPEWKKEIELWSDITELPKEKQGGALYFVLQGDARDTVRAKLDRKAIASDTGLTQITDILDKLYLKDAHQSGFTAYEQFIKYRRPAGTSIKDYIIQFNLKYSKIQSYNMTLPEGVLAYNLLICANLSDEQQQLCRATVSDMTYDEMKKTIEKVAVSCSNSLPDNQDRFQPLYNNTIDQTEESLYATYEPESYSPVKKPTSHESSSNDECEDTFYSNNRYNPPQHRSRFNSNQKFQNPDYPTLNPKDEFGKPTSCSFCHSVYHWVSDCPHAPPSAKFNRGQARC